MNIDVTPTITIILVILLLATLFCWCVGTVSAFKSHWVTGIIVIFIEPMPIIVGVCELAGYPLADKITALHLKEETNKEDKLE